MRRKSALACVQCGLWPPACGVLSYRGLCAACATANHVAQLEQMAAKAGPFYDAWLAAGGAAGRKA